MRRLMFVALVGLLAQPGFLGAFAGARLVDGPDPDPAVPVVATLLIGLGAFLTYRFLALRRPSADHRFPARVLGVAAGGLIVLINLRALADWAGATAVTQGLLASLVVTLWVLWTSWAVKLEQAGDPADPRSAVPVGS
ncbi:MAG TPA: hypothetical protein PK324_12280 [Nocardioides sp.]|uniref:hypothetical protein n=1 Tax=uncultured Nocardioides sp. TaxID=198441 RepID=UPI0026232484|nr:hypothetical protein [uncultured Nocardioides sp.]HRD61406.1 hypothetical protein [Nocardioides sp.]HRK46397.1 hypothetical protein [Nocardioides sp.]